MAVGASTLARISAIATSVLMALFLRMLCCTLTSDYSPLRVTQADDLHDVRDGDLQCSEAVVQHGFYAADFGTPSLFCDAG